MNCARRTELVVVPGALIDRYDGLVCDLDGVVYAGPSAVPHAIESLDAVTSSGRAIVYATNNASRPADEVAEHLTSLGLTVDGSAVINSSMAGAHVLAQDEGISSVLVVGGKGVALALREAGLQPVSCDEHRRGVSVEAVLQGYGAEVQASDLAEAAYAIQGGARWMATNTDRTLPTDRGRAPGNGSLVQAVRFAVAVDPDVAGKPQPVMYEMASERMGVDATRVLAVGDRLETDVEGAVTGGFDSVLVLTGVHGWGDAAEAPASRRPTYVLADLRELFEPYEVDDVLGPATLDTSATMSQRRGALRAAWAKVDGGEWSPQEARTAIEAAVGRHE